MPGAKNNAKGSLKLLQKTMQVADVNKFAVLEAIDGNPQSVKEFDEFERDEKDYFFRVSGDSTKVGNNFFSVVCNPRSRKDDTETGGKGSHLDFELHPQASCRCQSSFRSFLQ
jgi:hypothetical protein